MSEIPTIVIDNTGGLIQWAASNVAVHLIIIDNDAEHNLSPAPDGTSTWVGTEVPDVDPERVEQWEKAIIRSAQAEDALLEPQRA